MGCGVRAVFLTCLAGACVLSCNGDTHQGTSVFLKKLEQQSADAWHRLSERRIYFGHQSVGNNIMDGVLSIVQDHPEIELTIERTRNPEVLDKEPMFAHSSIGKNMDAQSKLSDFSNLIENGFGNRADIAFFKFCYIDFSAQTDVRQRFDDYQNTLSELKARYPETTFVHVTVPLVSKAAGLKDWIKKILGRSIKDPRANIRRNEYNELLRAAYGGKEPIFDLARAEATWPDGKIEKTQINSQTFDRLVPAYTMDGGHLNEMGKTMTAVELLLFLSKLTG
jgi:hypothetical protein